MSRKSGANFSDIVRIREMVAEGYSIEEIAANLLIDVEAVASHVEGETQSSRDEESDVDSDDE